MNNENYKFKPAYDFSKAPASVILNKGDAVVDIEGNKYYGLGEACLDFQPQTGIHFNGYFSGISSRDSIETLIGQKEFTSFKFQDNTIDGFEFGSDGDVPNQTLHIKWKPKHEPIVGICDETVKISHAVFHLFNFIDLISNERTWEKRENSTKSIWHIRLKCDEWDIELKSLYESDQAFKQLRETGGYQLTHIGDIKRADKKYFSRMELESILEGLSYYLFFAKGNRCVPICVVGFDEKDKRIYEEWSSPREEWKKTLSWYDPHHSIQIETLFSKYYKYWYNDNWRSTFKEIIGWYVEANTSKKDVGIILAQAAIERLSYEYVVKERQLISSRGFKELWASDKFRLLFSSLNIPLDIPKETENFHKIAGKKNIKWQDAPQGITDIRNSIIHPDHKNRNQFRECLFEVWNLSLWYLEMSILAICKYDGEYGNRLKLPHWVGEVENVPWKNKD